MWVLHQKLKRVSKRLSTWSKKAFRDIYEEPRKLEKQINDLEEALVVSNAPEHRVELNKAKAKYVYYIKIQDQVLRQKAKAKWLEDGDKHTTYFHSVIKGRRRRLCLRRIQDDNGQWRKGGAEIVEAAVEYFQRSFNHGEDSSDFSVLECVLPRISEEDNEMLVATPTAKKIKDSVFSIDPSSAPGPDGLSALFY